MLSSAVCAVGISVSQRVALPLQWEMESLWKRWWVVFLVGSQNGFPRGDWCWRWYWLFPCSRRFASLYHYKGNKLTPPWCDTPLSEPLFLLLLHTDSIPWGVAALSTICLYRGEMTWMSKATGLTSTQLQRNTSAGRLLQPLIRKGDSFLVGRAAEKAQNHLWLQHYHMPNNSPTNKDDHSMLKTAEKLESTSYGSCAYNLSLYLRTSTCT